MHKCFQGRTLTGTTFPGTDSRRTLSTVCRRLRPLLGLGLDFFLLVYQCLAPVLVFAGVELILFIVAGTELWFGFVPKTVLLIQGCFRYC